MRFTFTTKTCFKVFQFVDFEHLHLLDKKQIPNYGFLVSLVLIS